MSCGTNALFLFTLAVLLALNINSLSCVVDVPDVLLTYRPTRRRAIVGQASVPNIQNAPSTYYTYHLYFINISTVHTSIYKINSRTTVLSGSIYVLNVIYINNNSSIYNFFMFTQN